MDAATTAAGALALLAALAAAVLAYAHAASTAGAPAARAATSVGAPAARAAVEGATAAKAAARHVDVPAVAAERHEPPAAQASPPPLSPPATVAPTAAPAAARATVAPTAAPAAAPAAAPTAAPAVAPTAAPAAGAEDDGPGSVPACLPVKVLYASTTGTARGFADTLRREAFAMHVSGFHLAVTVVDLAAYEADDIEKETTLVVLLPTWTGGVAAATGVAFCDAVRDLATDFRVSKDTLARLRYAVFGLGNAEYDADWGRAALELDEHLATLGATRLVEAGRGNAAGDMEAQFGEWRARLWPMLCELYAREYGVADGLAAAAAASGGGSCGAGAGACGAASGAGVPSAAVFRAARTWEDDDAEVTPLPATAHVTARSKRRQTRTSTAPAATATGACCSDGGDGGGGACDCASSSAVGAAPRPAVAPGMVLVAATGELATDVSAWRPPKEYLARKEAQRDAKAGRLPGGARPPAAAAAAAAAVEDDDDADDDDDGVGTPAAAAVPTPGAGRGVEATAEDMLNDALLASADGAPVAAFVESDDEGSGGGGGGGAAAAAAAAAPPPPGEVLEDIEDIGAAVAAARSAAAGEAAAIAAASAAPESAPEMLTPAQRRALGKEGYKLIGSHSAVKMCRWTKAQLRGRGGCYKHTFYGIQSYQCMEMTPSLSCANKCTFCWRHHKNPVGREWRWRVDDPAMIVAQAVEHHQELVHQLKGMPGVKPERWREAFTVRHCALSLVGEPIMYPRVNDLVRLLHARAISTFMVTNAQFPECIARLGPVTQLYVSIDAATKETLKAIDRPLFKDFWERFLASLEALRAKRQRTVYRLTLLKGYNMGELDAYAELVARGAPDFIEVKGVTYCGTSPGSPLTMKDVPWHAEVKAFCEALAARLGEGYGLAAEHAHSCCVLLAKTSFKLDGAWHTNIDYPRFHELVQRYYATDGAATFGSMDYIAPTPAWAVYNADAGGFDPTEARWRRNKDGTTAAIEYKSSESGCG